MTDIAPIPTIQPSRPQRPPITAPSASERLIRALEAHASAEAHDLATYEELGECSADPVVKTVMHILIDDEQRHRALLESMLQRLQDEPELAPSSGDLPPVSPVAEPDPELAARLRALIRDEHEGARYLRHIARLGPHGLYPVLLEAIARDSEKHATILRYLLLRIENRED